MFDIALSLLCILWLGYLGEDTRGTGGCATALCVVSQAMVLLAGVAGAEAGEAESETLKQAVMVRIAVMLLSKTFTGHDKEDRKADHCLSTPSSLPMAQCALGAGYHHKMFRV